MFRDRVQSRMLDLAQAAYTAPVVTGSSKMDGTTPLQTKRLKLASLLQVDPTSYITPFAWWMVSISSYTTPDDITDQQIINNLQLTGSFDQIADQVLPP